MKIILTKLCAFLLVSSVLQAQTNKNKARDVFEFTYETQVEVQDKVDNKTYNLSYLLNPKEDYIGISVDMSSFSDAEVNGESIIVMDNGNSRIFVDTQGMKIQMSQSMMGGNQMNNPVEELTNYDYTQLQKTGETKTILGALCEKYIMSDKDVRIAFWVAPEIKLPNWFIVDDSIINGHIMEYTVWSKEGEMTSTVIAINDNISKTINTNDYKKMF